MEPASAERELNLMGSLVPPEDWRKECHGICRRLVSPAIVAEHLRRMARGNQGPPRIEYLLTDSSGVRWIAVPDPADAHGGDRQ